MLSAKILEISASILAKTNILRCRPISFDNLRLSCYDQIAIGSQIEIRTVQAETGVYRRSGEAGVGREFER